MLNPHKPKYFDLYWNIAYDAASQSVATRRQVGAVVVTPTGMLSIGWNGMPAGFANDCETLEETSIWFPSLGYSKVLGEDWVTKPEVIHAERNAIDKMTRQGVPLEGSLLFVTTAPCFECAKTLHGLGLAAIYYDDSYRCTRGIELLEQAGVSIQSRDKLSLAA